MDIVLNIYRKKLHIVGSQMREFVAGICPLLETVPHKSTRETVCHLLAEISKYVPEIAPVTALVEDLNSYSTSQVDTYDYSRRQAGYKYVLSLL